MAKGEFTNKLTVREFFKRFPDDAACLDHIMSVRFGHRHTCGKCGVIDATFHKLENRKAYCCAHCGDHLFPCAGTIFEDSRTPLQSWFYAIYLFTVSRNGVAAKELERALGVTYKCAWRMARQIRTLMGKADNAVPQKLSGIVEADEVFMGGVALGAGGDWREHKTIVIGLKERGGRLVTKVVPDLTARYVQPLFRKHVEKGAAIHTDESRIYDLLDGAGYDRRSVNHSKKEYARPDFLRGGDTIHVNGLENFWGHLQASVRGTHVHISKQHADRYVAEFTYRANSREMGNAMFDALIAAL